MASQHSSTRRRSAETSRRNPSFKAFEELELFQTEGSDIEEDFGDSDEDCIDSEASGSESEESGGGGDGDSDEAAQAERRGGERVQHMSEEEIWGFMMQDWHEDFRYFPFMPPFTGEYGLHTPQGCHDPVQFFHQIIDDQLLDFIVVQTNKYASENLRARGELKEKSIFRMWPQEGITKKDLLGFFAICVHMGLVHKPAVKDYWSTNPVLQSPFASNVMARDKFSLILAMLHVADNDTFIPAGREGHDPLHKIHPVCTHLCDKFQALYTPRENVCVDEAVCAWSGKTRLGVYMKDKPIKWGIKLHELCESDTGYVYNFEIFAAKNNASNRPVDVVMRLMEPLLDAGRSVYVDDYYACPVLAEKLVQRKTHCVGMVRPNRKGLPPQLKTEPLPPDGQVQAFRQGAVAVLRWMNRNPVHLITTRVDPHTMTDVTTRCGQFRKPLAVQDYLHNMAGVNKSEQLMSYMPLNRKTMKWWKKLFFHLFTLSLIQGSILYNIYLKEQGRATISLKDFVVAVGHGLNDRYQTEVAASDPEPTAEPDPEAAPALDPVPGPSTPGTLPTPMTRLSGKGHFSCPLPKYQSGRSGFRRCIVCTARSKHYPDVRLRKTSNWCRKCAKPLCDKLAQPSRNVTCFHMYHTAQNFVVY